MELNCGTGTACRIENLIRALGGASIVGAAAGAAILITDEIQIGVPPPYPVKAGADEMVGEPRTSVGLAVMLRFKKGRFSGESWHIHFVISFQFEVVKLKGI